MMMMVIKMMGIVFLSGVESSGSSLRSLKKPGDFCRLGSSRRVNERYGVAFIVVAVQTMDVAAGIFLH